MVVGLVDSSNVSLAWTDGKGSNSLGSTTKTEVGDRSHSVGIPDVHSRHFTALSSGDDVPVLSSCDINGGDIILMSWPVRKILVSILVLLTSSKESLLSSGEILDDSESGSGKHDLIVVLSEVKHRLVSISRESIDMIDLISAVWYGWISLDS